MSWHPDAERIPTPKTTPRGRSVCDLAVLHYTASPFVTGPRGQDHAGSDIQRQRRWLEDASRKSSTHFIILRDGHLIQAAPLEVATWHSGGSYWRGEARVNHRSVGIDFDNVGFITEDGRNAYGGVHGGPVVAATAAAAQGRKRLWEPYTAAQMATAVKLVAWLVQQLPVLREIDRWVGHSDIRETKSDPGPALPWPWIQAATVPAFDPDLPIDWSKVPLVAP